MAVLQKNWKELIRPSSINIEYLNDRKDSASIIIEPLERGFGNTLGNSIRRVLLSSIMGFAVTSIKIDGVLHEYSLIDGVKEDVFDIIMNIKSLIIDKSSATPGILKLKTNKKGTLYASDIETTNDIKILNPNLVICHIEDDVDFNMTMTVEYGGGYSLASERVKTDKDVSTIYLDALFNPVKKVAYRVENARIGQKTDYDKLIMNIETNGAIGIEDAIGLAAKILQEQLSFLINFDVISEEETADNDTNGDLSINLNLLKKIEEMELSVRSYNCLRNENITYIADLVQKTEAEMLKLPNFGRKSLTELKDNLKTMGLSFGMSLNDFNSEELIKELNKKRSSKVSKNS